MPSSPSTALPSLRGTGWPRGGLGLCRPPAMSFPWPGLELVFSGARRAPSYSCSLEDCLCLLRFGECRGFFPLQQKGFLLKHRFKVSRRITCVGGEVAAHLLRLRKRRRFDGRGWRPQIDRKFYCPSNYCQFSGKEKKKYPLK